MDAHERMASVSSMRMNRIDVNLKRSKLCRRKNTHRSGGDAEYDAYNRQLKFESDFDKQIKKFLDGTGPDPTA